MRVSVAAVVLVVLAAGCATFPDGAYYPPPSERTTRLAQTLWRVAEAAGDDATRYSFALVQTDRLTALSADDAIFYFSEGLAAQSGAHIDALVAQAVAHEVLGHAGERRALSIGISSGFAVLGFVVPGLGFADLVVNPLIVRAFSREQTLAADRKAVEILAALGYQTPRRALAGALEAAAAVNGRGEGGLLAREPDVDARLTALRPLESPEEILARR